MGSPMVNPVRRLEAARRLFAALGAGVETGVFVRLWDGSQVAFGNAPDPHLEISLSEPGVLASLLRRPTADNLLRRFAAAQVDYHGLPILRFGDALRTRLRRRALRPTRLARALGHALPLLSARAPKAGEVSAYAGNERGLRRRRDGEFVSFHYDVPSAFFALFLGPTMQYSCGWFEGGTETLEQAQAAKLERICRHLALRPGETLLDVGCGWGELVCHAALYHGARAHGVTLSREQHAYAQERIRKLGLEDRATVAHDDFARVKGRWDKIACIEMFEHVGLENLPAHFRRIRGLLRDDGVFVHQGGAGRPRRRRRRSRDTRLAQRYLLPGAELPDLGRTVEAMDRAGLEIRSLENWRLHYLRTTEHWVGRLEAELGEASRLVGRERARLWLLLLAGLHWAGARSSAQLYHVIAAPRVRG